jgi:hypothetical protein
MNNQIAEAVAAFSIFALIGWVLYLFFRRYQVTKQLQSQRIDSFNRMVEKFGNAREFIEFAQTPQGKKLLEEPVDPRPNPLNKILRFLQAGILFIMVGVGYYINAMRLADLTDINFVNERMHSFHWGALSLCLGVGLLIAAWISYIFVQRWHLANGESKP